MKKIVNKIKDEETDNNAADDYLRIGTSFYKQIEKPLISGDTLEMLAPWSKDCIRDDIGKPLLDKVKKYDGFCCVPSHTNFKQVISNFYNTYKDLPYKPETGDITLTVKFLKHIFGEQLEIGLDYFKILYEKPTQILPVLCLVSKERNTGKTTFLNWMKNIFGANMTCNTNDDFRSQFNSDWASKLIIAVDEVLLDKTEDSERIKNLSTARTYKIEAKGKDKSENEFFGVFILCSNNERTFIKIESGEIRFWVRQIMPFQTEDENLLDKLIKEIPAFFSYLAERQYSTPSSTRMWFTKEQLQTEALKRLISYNRNALEIELVNSIIEIMDNFELSEFQFCIKDLENLMGKSSYKQTKTRIKNIVRDDWKLIPSENSLTYKRFIVLTDGTLIEGKDKGRFYTLEKTYLLENYDELMNSNSK